jgi:hypothetical protein
MRQAQQSVPRRIWTPESFKAFWHKPTDPWRVLGSVTDDIVGYWPRPIGVIRGAHDYVQVIVTLLDVCPDFSLEVPEVATSGDLNFVRWIARGTGPSGEFRFNGCDRVRLRDGLVCENYVFCDDPFFGLVADRLRKHCSSPVEAHAR